MVALFTALFVATSMLTAGVRRYALARLVDVPNARSSHTVATPRGGGIALVITSLLALAVLAAIGVLDWRETWAFLGGGALVAALGFADDHRDLPAKWRLAGQFLAAIWIVGLLGGAPPIEAFGVALGGGALGYILAVLYLVWLCNLFNFMDGIDGIAGAETVTVCVGAAIATYIAQPASELWILPLILAGAALGFLLWNWPPAKIFMGDVGAAFIGLLMGAFAIAAGHAMPRLFWCWTILLGAFIVDATITLFARIARGERFYEAHRSHAYQHAAVRAGGHLPVTLAVAAINVFWLLPWAVLVALGRIDGALATAIAYVPLILVVVAFKAGRQFEPSFSRSPKG